MEDDQKEQGIYLEFEDDGDELTPSALARINALIENPPRPSEALFKTLTVKAYA